MGMRGSIAAALAAALFVSAGAAQAKVWSFTYSGIGESGFGTFITSDAGSPYTVTGIMGTVTDSSGFAGASAITGLSAYAGADQTLNAPTTASYFTFSGVSFSTAAGVEFNFSSLNRNANYILNSANDPGGFGGSAVALDMTVTAIPEASTWAMLFLGFAGLGWAGLHGRKRREGALG